MVMTSARRWALAAGAIVVAWAMDIVHQRWLGSCDWLNWLGLTVIAAGAMSVILAPARWPWRLGNALLYMAVFAALFWALWPHRIIDITCGTVHEQVTFPRMPWLTAWVDPVPRLVQPGCQG